MARCAIAPWQAALRVHQDEARPSAFSHPGHGSGSSFRRESGARPGRNPRAGPAPRRRAPSIKTAGTYQLHDIGKESMKTWKLTLEYDGTKYSGWQEQTNARTVAGSLRTAI